MTPRFRLSTASGTVVAVLVLGLSVVTAATGSGGILDDVRAFGRTTQAIISAPGHVAVLVDGQTIDSQTIAPHQAAIERNGIPSGEARRRAIDKAIHDLLVASEASRRGLVVGEAEIDAFIAAQRSANAAAPAENRAMFSASLDGAGLTEEQYWSSQAMRGAVRSMITRSKLTGQLTPSGASRAQAAAKLDEFVQALRNKAVIRVLQ